MIKIIKDERGFMLIHVIFLTLITSFAAMLLFHVAPLIKSPQATLRLTALYLANEQIAHLESSVPKVEFPSKVFLGNSNDLKTMNTGDIIEFEVTTDIKSFENPCKVKVTVSWFFEGKENSIEVERTIWIVENS